MTKEPTKLADQNGPSAAKTKLGIRLFVFYTMVYAAFVAINTIWPKSMGIEVFWGLNLAVVYGFGLILFAIIFGLVFHLMCNTIERNGSQAEEGKGS